MKVSRAAVIVDFRRGFGGLRFGLWLWGGRALSVSQVKQHRCCLPTMAEVVMM